MTGRLRILTRVAVFAALVFVFSYFSVSLYNFNPAFFIVFLAGYLWGIQPGIAVGAVGFFLYSNFNPYGPAPFPILISQLIGISFTAVIGSGVSRMITRHVWGNRTIFILALAGFMSGPFVSCRGGYCRRLAISAVLRAAGGRAIVFVDYYYFK